jgi:hypothetical protein
MPEAVAFLRSYPKAKVNMSSTVVGEATNESWF